MLKCFNGVGMTKEEAVQYRERWDFKNRARSQEVRQMSFAQKIQDLELLFEFGERLGWPPPADGESWEYWRKLKELSNV
jgi:hypothetical protein